MNQKKKKKHYTSNLILDARARPNTSYLLGVTEQRSGSYTTAARESREGFKVHYALVKGFARAGADVVS